MVDADTADLSHLVHAAPTLHAVSKAVLSGLESLKAQPYIRLADWAQEHFRLVGDSSHTTGRWELWPFQVGLLDWMGDDAIEELDVRKSKRTGYTKSVAALMAFNAARRHRKQALWQPTDDDRDSFVATEIDPVLEAVKVLREARRATKGGRERVSLKRFRSSVAHFLGGKAARAYRRITVSCVILDEVDGFDQQIEKAGDPITLAQGRLEGAAFPKTVCGTTPRKKLESHIEHREQLADVLMRFHITCPHCQAEHPLIFGGIGKKKLKHGLQWKAGEPASVVHICPHCRESITQGDYLENWEGTWVCDRTGLRYGADRTWRDARGNEVRPPRHVAAHVWAAYSPQRSWESIARETEAAERKKKTGDDGSMKVLVNETLGETWEDDYEKSDSSALRSRAEPYPLRLVPRRGLIVFSGVDLQDDRLIVTTAAFGRDEECWVIDDREIYGNPGEWSLWLELDKHLATRYPHAGGQTCANDAVAIDTAGHHTHMAYRYAMLRAARRVYATAGYPGDGKPIVAGAPTKVDVNADGQVIKDGLKRWMIGTGNAKDLLNNRLQLRGAEHPDAPAPGFIHFSSALQPHFYDELTAEIRVQVRVARGFVTRWVKPTSSTPNHRLDCMVGILFCAERFNLRHYSDADWTRLERALCPPTADLFTAPVIEPLPEPAPATSAEEVVADPAAPILIPAQPVLSPGRRRMLSGGVE